MCGDLGMSGADWRSVEMCEDLWRCVEMSRDLDILEMCGDLWRGAKIFGD